jgi:CRP-like cAMP-binding protein
VSPNRILSRLSREDFGLLEPHLEAVDLPVKKPLETRKRRISDVYFIESGFASVVANGTAKPSIEVGLIGREGFLCGRECGVCLGRFRRSFHQ